MSIGVAQYQSEDVFESVIKSADEALYATKKNGRDGVDFCSLTEQSPGQADSLVREITANPAQRTAPVNKHQ